MRQRKQKVFLLSLVLAVLLFLPLMEQDSQVVSVSGKRAIMVPAIEESHQIGATSLQSGTNEPTMVLNPKLDPVQFAPPKPTLSFEEQKAKIFASVDKDGDKIHDELNSVLAAKASNGTLADPVEVIVAVEDGELDTAIQAFTQLGGNLTHRFEHAFYGFAGLIAYDRIDDLAAIGQVDLVERDQPMRRYSDTSTLLTDVRTYIWDTLGYTGDWNSSIAVLDTGIDDTHPMISPYGDQDFANSKIVGWHDATGDGSTSPEDQNSHGSHCAGIAAGKEYNSSADGNRIRTTWGIKYSTTQSAAGYFVYYLEVKAAGTIDVMTLWSGDTNVGSNDVLLRSPNGTIVDQVSNSNSQRNLSYTLNENEVGIFSVWVHVSFPGGLTKEFRATGINVYPYSSPTDGHLRFSGVAPDTKLVSVKVFDNTGSGTATDLVNGLDWVVANAEKYHIVVASMSLGFSDTVGSVDTATANLVAKGIVTCVAAGNDGQGANHINTPGHVDGVICVAATGDHNRITSYSSEGPGHGNTTKPDLAAPGGVSSQGAILSVDSNDQEADGAFAEQQPNDMAIMQGTSMACPYVAGLSALLAEAMGGSANWVYDSTSRPYTIKQILMMTSYEVATINRGDKDTVEGYGRVCADAALEAYLYAHTIGTAESATISSGDFGRKAWARHISLTAGTTYTFNLDVPDGADYDLFLYSGNYDAHGEPILLERSINFAPGASEHITYTPSSSGNYYIVVKYVSGNGGQFTFSSSSGTSVPTVNLVTPSENQVLTGEFTVQVSASGTGLSNVMIRFSNDTWIDITDDYNSGTGYYEYTMNVSCLELRNVTFIAKAVGSGGIAYDSSNVFVKIGTPVILLVDDDNGASYEKYFKDALSANGYYEGMGFAVWTVSTDGSPSSATLSSYDIVIWFTSEDYSTTLSDTDRTNIQTYLNNGGKLFISGQDIGYDASSSNPSWVDWIQTNLHANYVRDDTDANGVAGVSGDTIFDGVSYGLGGGDGARDNDYPDEITSYNGGVVCMNYSISGNNGSAVRYSGTYKVVYFAFNFEAISDSADRNDAMKRVLNFLDEAPDLRINYPNNNVYISSPFRLNWTASDDYGISYSEVYVDGQFYARVTNNSILVTLTDGNHTIRVITVDTANQLNRDRVVLHADSTNPSVVFVSPSAEAVVKSGTTVDVEVSDANLEYSQYRWDTGTWANWTSPYDTSVPSGDGSHTLYVRAYDLAGNINSTSCIFVTDDTKPTITLVSPSDGSVIQSGSTIDLDISDAHLSTVYFHWDSDSWAVMSSPYDTTAPSGDGTHTLYVNATDQAGNIELQSYSFVIDDTDPTVTLVSPANNTVQPGGTTVDLDISDAHLSTVYYHWDSDSWAVMSSPYDTQIPNAPGTHVLYVNATDQAGNYQYKVYVWTVQASWSPPEITLVSPGNGSVVNGGTTVDLNITDADGDLSTVYYHWDSNGWAVLPSPYDTTVPTGDGDHTLYVNATDAAGHYTLKTYVFTTDDTPPTITLNGPADGSEITSGTTIDLSVTDANAINQVLFNWDGGANQTLSSPYDVSTTGLSEGSHTLNVHAQDEAGNWQSSSFTYIIDDTPPTITLNSPAAGSEIQPGVNIDLSVTDTNTLSNVLYNWDGNANQTLGSPYDVDTSGLSDGTHVLHVYAYDEAGNGQYATYSFVIDSTAPTIVLISPANGAEIKSGTTINLNVSDAHTLNETLYAWDGDTNATLSSPYDVSTSGLSEGNHTLHVYACDQAGNWAEQTYSFIIDDTAPTITLNSPPDGAEIQPGTTIDLSVGDANTLSQVLYHWDSDANATLASPYDVSTTGLSDGTHVLHVFAIDEAGNQRGETYTFIIDSTAPTIVLNSPPNGSEIKSGTIIDLDVSDTNTLSQVLYHWDGNPDATLASPYDVSTSGLNEGSHTLYIYAEDAAGNSRNSSYVFIIDDTAPTITLNSPANGAEIKSGTTIDLSVSDANTIYTVLYAWDGDANSTLNSPYDVSTAGLSEGSHQLHVYARDNAENWQQATYTFIIDDTAPTITLNSPNDGDEIQSGTKIDLDVTEANTLSWVVYNWDGSSNSSLSSPYDVSTTGLTEGTHVLHVYAGDLAGNKQSASYTFVIDDTAPTITLNNPADNSEIKSSTDIDLDVSDTNTLYEALYAWDGNANSSLSSPYDVSTTGLTEGTHILHVYARDNAENWASETYTFIIDDTAPTITLNTPSDNSEIQSGTTIDLSVTETNTLSQVLYAWDGGSNSTLPSPYDVSTSGLNEGTHVLHVYAGDAADNWASESYTFIIDDTAPTITLNTPADGSEIQSGTTIDLTVTDANTFSVLYNWDGGANATLASPYDVSTATLGEGVHTLHVYAQDNAENKRSETYTFTIDNTAPTIILDSPADGSEIQSGTTIGLTVTDDNTIHQVWYNWDHGSNATLASPYDIDTTGLSEGSHTLYVFADDEAGNEAQQTYTFIIDDTAPTITLNSPADNSQIQSGTNIDLSVSDTNTLDQTWYNWDHGSNQTLNAPYDVSTTGLSEAAHTLYVFALDDAGNLRATTFSFIIDDTAPTISLNSPSDGSEIQSGTTIDLSVTDANTIYSVVYAWDSNANSTLNSPYDVDTTGLSEGTHQLHVYARDNAENWQSAVYSFIIDDTAPIITLNTPANESVIQSGSVIDLSISDINTIDFSVYSWNGGSNNTLNSPYDVSTSGLSEGENILDVYSYDLAGNGRHKVYSFTIDDTAPTIVLVSPANNTIQNSGTTVTVQITDAHLNLVGYYWDAGGWTTWNSPYTTTIPSGDGSHVLYINATDQAGNIKLAQCIYETDDTPPSVILNGPANGTTHHSGTIIDLSVSDPNLSSVLYHWDSNAWTTFPAPYDTSLPTGDGQHYLYVNATDSVGNWQYERYIFSTDDSQPLIILHSPTNNSVCRSGTLVNVSVIDSDLDYVQYKWDSDAWAIWNDPYDTYLPVGDGTHILYINATDKSNNYEYTSYSFTTDDTDPTVQLITPNNGTVHHSGVSIDISVSDANLDTVHYRWDGGAWQVMASPYDTTLPSGEGDHTLEVNATDLAGNNAVESYQFVTDDVVPTVTLNSPSNNTVQNSGTLVNVSVSDLHLVQVLYWWGTDAPQVWSDPYDTTVPTGESMHTLHVNATDQAGNNRIVSYVFTTDDTAPTIILNSPGNATVQQSGTTVNLTITDLHLDQVEIQWDGGGWVILAAPYLTAIPSGDGSHVLSVRASDMAGNAAETPYQWTADNTVPSILLTGPANNTVVNGTTYVVLDITDLHLTSVEYRWDGGGWVAASEPYRIPVPAVDGMHTLNVLARDEAGNEALETYVYTVDSTKPVIALVSPMNGTIHESGVEITLSITDDQLDTVMLSWDSATWIVITAPYTTPLPSGDGVHVLSVWANDSIGNQESTQYTFYSDDNAPSISGPGNLLINEFESGNSFDWTITDVMISRYTIYLDGNVIENKSIDSTSEQVTISLESLTLGTYNYTIQVYDTLDHVNTDVVIVTVRDGTTPLVTSPPDITYNESDTGHTISWDIYDLHPVSYEIYRDGTLNVSSSWTDTNITVTISADGLTLGTHNFTIRVIDIGGNSATDSVDVVVIDGKQPTITSPEDLAFNEGETGHSITWHAYDEHPFRYEISCDDELVKTGLWNASGDAITFNVDNLGVGAHAVVIEVFDVAGNSVTDIVIVVINQVSSSTTTTPGAPNGTTTTNPGGFFDFLFSQGNSAIIIVAMSSMILVLVVVIVVARKRGSP